MNLIPQFLIKNNIMWKTKLLLPYIKDSKTILDFGCGDLSLARSLKIMNSKLEITGLDVVRFSQKVPGVTFRWYDGKKIPFKNNSFDTVIAFYVFHHCPSAQASFEECFRVAKKRVIFVEPVMRYPFENYLMGAIDWIFNIWKEQSISYGNQFMRLSDWKKIIKKKGKYKAVALNSFFPIPIGKAYIFEAIKE